MLKYLVVAFLLCSQAIFAAQVQTVDYARLSEKLKKSERIGFLLADIEKSLLDRGFKLISPNVDLSCEVACEEMVSIPSASVNFLNDSGIAVRVKLTFVSVKVEGMPEALELTDINTSYLLQMDPVKN